GKLLARVFKVDVTICRRCGGRMRVDAAVTRPDDIARELRGARPPPRPEPVGQQRLFGGGEGGRVEARAVRRAVSRRGLVVSKASLEWCGARTEPGFQRSDVGSHSERERVRGLRRLGEAVALPGQTRGEGELGRITKTSTLKCSFYYLT